MRVNGYVNASTLQSLNAAFDPQKAEIQTSVNFVKKIYKDQGTHKDPGR